MTPEKPRRGRPFVFGPPVRTAQKKGLYQDPELGTSSTIARREALLRDEARNNLGLPRKGWSSE